jgi:hypothetical protein
MLQDDRAFDDPFQADDQFIEYDPSDPAWGEPADWPSTQEIDGEHWEPSESDWEDYRQWCEHVDRLDAIRRMEDSEWEKRMRFGV